MIDFDDLVKGTRLAGVVADGEVTVVALERMGDSVATLTCRTADGNVDERLLTQDDLQGINGLLTQPAEKDQGSDEDNGDASTGDGKGGVSMLLERNDVRFVDGGRTLRPEAWFVQPDEADHLAALALNPSRRLPIAEKVRAGPGEDRHDQHGERSEGAHGFRVAIGSVAAAQDHLDAARWRS